MTLQDLERGKKLLASISKSPISHILVSKLLSEKFYNLFQNEKEKIPPENFQDVNIFSKYYTNNLFGIDVIVSDDYPIEEVIEGVKTGRKIIGAMHSRDDVVYLVESN